MSHIRRAITTVPWLGSIALRGFVLAALAIVVAIAPAATSASAALGSSSQSTAVFSLTITDHTGKVWSLGQWGKVEGLDVTWDLPDYRAGDQGNQRWYFPGNTKYTSVKLSRARNADSATVKQWLSTNDSRFKSSSTGVITLRRTTDGATLHTWTLVNVMPKRWNIASIDAGSSNVMVETLELAHQGFLPS